MRRSTPATRTRRSSPAAARTACGRWSSCRRRWGRAARISRRRRTSKLTWSTAVNWPNLRTRSCTRPPLRRRAARRRADGIDAGAAPGAPIGDLVQSIMKPSSNRGATGVTFERRRVRQAPLPRVAADDEAHLARLRHGIDDRPARRAAATCSLARRLAGGGVARKSVPSPSRVTVGRLAARQSLPSCSTTTCAQRSASSR